MRPRRVQIGAGLGIALFCFLVLTSGFDRMSETREAFERFVPESMQVGAAKRRSATALSEEDYTAAAELARAAVLRDPLDARGLAFFASARLLAGDGGDADRAFGVARQLGRREPLTQVYFLSQSLDRGDFEQAAVELDALLRSGRRDAAVAQTYFSLLEQSDAGRRALGERLAQNPRWSDVYLRAQGTSAATLRARGSFLARADNGVSKLGCEATLPMIRELAKRNFRREAEGLAARHCDRVARGSIVADPQFLLFGDEEAGALGWRRFNTGDVRVTRLSGERARIELENRASVSRRVLAQPIAVVPGRYRIAAKVDGPGGERLMAGIACGRPERPRAARDRIDGEGLLLDAPACDNQLLSLWLRPGAGRVVIDSVTLAPADR
ncbi:hypothetical protein [Erythrobacter mangrovi]|uniref:Tetratricopeptide repeat protein n=1 Tax=Erythrobacter mangrovi TaxID=2739433 RepID=A0A7D3XXC7_9SPHN|nr:hypothetical protein [Erythrobacter mangrovi]QKG72456.1 hypothetical protein HQR01_14355 [Erythrobacter mangrovi]